MTNKALPYKRTISIKKCIYPECNICAETCPVGAIDLTSSPPTIRSSCLNCSVCDRICPKEAITLDKESEASFSQKIIDTTLCIYPECSLCIEHCPMDAIDFSKKPPTFNSHCEKDELCWCICPYDAIKITNMEQSQSHMVIRNQDHPFCKWLNKAEKDGKFRRLIPITEVGFNNIIMNKKGAPRLKLED